MIRPCLRDIINNHKTQGEWKIQLTMSINFISSKDLVIKQIKSLKSFLILFYKNIKKI